VLQGDVEALAILGVDNHSNRLTNRNLRAKEINLSQC
jgi:hypothetical protein